MNCQYCSNSFSTKMSLLTHQKTAKYCLKLRDIDIPTIYTCPGCSKIFPKKYEYNRHIAICESNIIVAEHTKHIKELEKENEKINIENNTQKLTIDRLEETIKEQKQIMLDLQNKIQELAIKAISRSTNTKNTQINNYIQQLKPVTDEHLQDNLQYLSIEHILKGPEGYAEYALEYPLKDRLICVDYSRRKVKFKDKDGNIITDPEMSNLATKFFISIKEKNKALILEYGEKLKENFGDEIDTIVKILDYKTAVDNGSDGCSRTDFHHDFVKQMCCKTIKD